MDLATSPTAGTVAATEAAPPAVSHAHPMACLNCDTPLTDKFCPHCGQSAATHRLSMGHLLHEIPHTIWHVDKGIFYTLRELLLRPGATILGYLQGQRARHFAPISLLLLVTGVTSFVAAKLHIGELAQTALDPNTVAELREANVHASEWVMRYMGWLYVAAAPFIALFARRVLRRNGLNLAENLVAVLYVTAAGNLLSLLLMPAYYWARTGPSYAAMSLAGSVVFTLYQTWAYGQLLLATPLSRWGRWWRGLVTALATYGLVLGGTLVVMFASNWGAYKKGFQKEVERQRALLPKSAPATAPRP
ncbi:DUF3667 domain-containing protein [Hymenobacter negativus]|uniref:DUF3667 domain-containing protein n=1 Tax=Hymenobacter negativus TaxID=2795026 RepID=A0ABS3QAX1_9BACT|nr:DUF3667 domain-containing protein [Hymenobacter negativus]MBO2008108.1 DUF3667 domain-containing protein [Hymenobacter negativus]